MAFTVSTNTSQETSDTTTHTVALPDGSDVAGKRVIVIIGVDSNAGLPGVSWPSGWTQFATDFTADTNGYAAYRDIDGTEGFTGTNDTIQFTTTASEQSNHHSYLIEGHDPDTAPEAATAINPTGDLPDPPSLTPSWGADDNLWIAVAVARFSFTFSSAPTDYGNLLAQNGGDANAPLGTARRIGYAATEDPDEFGGGTNSRWVVMTIAVRPEIRPVREFDGTDDQLVTDIGAVSGMTYGTVAAVFEVDDFSDFRAVAHLHDSGGSFVGSPLYVDQTSGSLSMANATSSATGPAISTGTKYLVVARKASGGATPRFSVYDYSTGTWSHANASGTLANWSAPGTGGSVQFSFEDGTGDLFSGRVAVRALWSNSVPWSADTTGDSQIEALGLETDLQNWSDQSPDALWVFNQGDGTEVAVSDDFNSYTDGNALDSESTDWDVWQASGDGAMTLDHHDNHSDGSLVVDMFGGNDLGDAYAIYQTALGSDDHYAEVDVYVDLYTDNVAENQYGPIVRGSASSMGSGTFDGYMACLERDNSDTTPPGETYLRIYRIDNDVPTLLASSVDINGETYDGSSSGAQARVRLEIVGDELTAYSNGVELVSTTDATYTTGKHVGVRANRARAAVDSQPFFDNFYAQDWIEAVGDLTGGGADQTSITGTTVITNDPVPGFSYELSASSGTDADAEAASATATAEAAMVDVGPMVETATATADGQDATVTVTGEPDAETASASALALDATVDAVNDTVAVLAETATATGEAQDVHGGVAPTALAATGGAQALQADISASSDVSTGRGDASALALDAVISTSDNVQAQAETATAVGAALDAVPVGQANVNAETATASAIVEAPNKDAIATTATASAEARSASVSTQEGTLASPDVASAAGLALDATATISGEQISAEPAEASVIAVALDATVNVFVPPPPTYSFFPPVKDENLVSDHPFIQRLHWERGLSVVKKGGEFVTVRYVVPEKLDGQTEGVHYFVGGFHYTRIPESVALALIDAGYEPELEEV